MQHPRETWKTSLVGDVRFAVRYFARHKAAVAIIVAVLALGTGANTLIFSIIQSELIRPAPALTKDDSRVRIWMRERVTPTAAFELRSFTHAEYLALTSRPAVFRDVAGWIAEDVILQAGDSATARGVGAQFVTPNYFATLGLALAAGPGLARDPGNTPEMTAVMAHRAATDMYGSAAAAVGQRILVNEVPLRVVGVAPPRFQGAKKNMNEPALWLPLSARADLLRIPPRWIDTEPALLLFGRMAPGIAPEQANAFLQQFATTTLADSAARVGMTRTAEVRGINRAPPGVDTAETILAFAAIAAAGILILLIAWMNVSSLMVAAAVGRRHEIAVRLSLGASRARLLRQLVTESTVLAFAGGTLGLVIAWWMLTYMQRTEVAGVDVMPDFATFAFTLGIAVITGIVFGLSPALHATRGRVAAALRDSKAGSVGRSRLQRTFVVAQIMLSQPLLLLLGAALALIIADYKPLSPEMSEKVIAVAFRPLKNAAASQRAEAVDALIPRIAEQPGVVSAVPESDAFDVRGVMAPPADRVQRGVATDSLPTVVHLEGTAPGWFATVDVPIILGRDVSYADTAAADYPVVIGSDLARSLWGDAHPIGRRLASAPLPGLEQDSIMMTVVGVYDATVRLPGMRWGGNATRTNVNDRVYTARGRHWRHDRVLVRTRASAAPFIPELQQFLRNTASSLPVTWMRTLAQSDEMLYRDTLKASAIAGAGGALALLLASLGLYGVVSLAVQQRTREIGVRIAVGARPGQVARMFLASGVKTGTVALALGLPLSMAALRVGMSQGLIIAPGVNVWAIGAVIAMILLAMAAAATWVPARRAARVDP
ncbi:MAG: ABC transporter permease, partial [Gemmatimonadaceae bacterium]